MKDRTLLRLKIAGGFCVGLALLVVGRAVQLQWIGDPRLANLAQKQFKSKVLIKPKRGIILDRNGEALAVNIETQSLAANPGQFKNNLNERNHISKILARALGMSERKIRQKLSASDKDFIWLQRNLPSEAMERFKRLKLLDSQGELPDGLWLVKEQRRAYPNGDVAAQVIGDVNIDMEGMEGAELWFNDRMKGKIASFESTRDALGRPTFIDAAAERHLENGKDIRLTLDASLQYSVENALVQTTTQHRAAGGTVIVMDADSGEILAMANQPGFDPTHRGVSSSARRNRAVTDAFEPGSTVKPLLMAAALSHGWKPEELVWGGEGSFVVQGHKISEAETHEKFKWMTLKKIIQVSSNVGAAKVAMKIGAENLLTTFQTLGIGTRSGLGFPGEISGRLPNVPQVKPIELATLGFGHGLMATPLQMTRAYASLLNGGWLVKPQLVFEKQEEKRRVFSEKTVNQVMDALLAVTESEEGTGHKARLPGYRVAGKTGTAQMVDPKTRRYSKTKYFSSFIGFAPEITPRVVIYVGIEAPQVGYYGGDIAAPLFSQVLRGVVTRFSVPGMPVAPPVLAEKPAAPAAPVVKDKGGPIDQIVISSASVERQSFENMPDLMGLSVREAMNALGSRKVDLRIHGPAAIGTVRKQTPAAGSSLASGARVNLTFGD